MLREPTARVSSRQAWSGHCAALPTCSRAHPGGSCAISAQFFPYTLPLGETQGIRGSEYEGRSSFKAIHLSQGFPPVFRLSGADSLRRSRQQGEKSIAGSGMQAGGSKSETTGFETESPCPDSLRSDQAVKDLRPSMRHGLHMPPPATAHRMGGAHPFLLDANTLVGGYFHGKVWRARCSNLT